MGGCLEHLYSKESAHKTTADVGVPVLQEPAEGVICFATGCKPLSRGCLGNNTSSQLCFRKGAIHKSVAPVVTR